MTTVPQMKNTLFSLWAPSVHPLVCIVWRKDRDKDLRKKSQRKSFEEDCDPLTTELGWFLQVGEGKRGQQEAMMILMFSVEMVALHHCLYRWLMLDHEALVERSSGAPRHGGLVPEQDFFVVVHAGSVARDHD